MKKYQHQINYILSLRKKRIKKIKLHRVRKHKRVPTNYHTYIKSKFWKRRKIELFKTRSKLCDKCGSNKNIQVHHLKYDYLQFGKEKDSDLAILCNDCHELFHSRYGVKHSCHSDYIEFLAISDEVIDQFRNF